MSRVPVECVEIGCKTEVAKIKLGPSEVGNREDYRAVYRLL